MFVRQLDSVPTPNKSGLVLSLHKKTKKYFLNTANDVQRYIRGLKHFIIQQEGGTHAFIEFRLLAKDSIGDDWEFYYSLSPTAPIPEEIQHHYTYQYSNVPNDAVIAKHRPKAIFKVEHKNTILPVYVVDQTCAKKNAVLRKAISQLKKYTNAGERAWYAQYISGNAFLFVKTLDVFECCLDQLGKNSMHDIRYEPVAYDDKNFVTHTAAVANLNLQALKDWKQSQVKTFS